MYPNTQRYLSLQGNRALILILLFQVVRYHMDPFLTRSLLKTNATESKFQVEPEIHLNCSSGRDSKEIERTQSYKLLAFKAIMYNLISSKIMAGWHSFPEWPVLVFYPREQWLNALLHTRFVLGWHISLWQMGWGLQIT